MQSKGQQQTAEFLFHWRELIKLENGKAKSANTFFHARFYYLNKHDLLWANWFKICIWTTECLCILKLTYLLHHWEQQIAQRAFIVCWHQNSCLQHLICCFGSSLIWKDREHMRWSVYYHITLYNGCTILSAWDRYRPILIKLNIGHRPFDQNNSPI